MRKRTSLLRTAMACLVFFLAVMALWQPVEAADVQVVANKNAPDGAMDEAMIKNVFLGKTTSWSDGSPIEFVILADGPAHEAFLKAFVKKTPAQFSTYWKKMVFTGKGATPKSFATDSELVSYVAGHNGAVGYVSGAADVAAVKVVNQQ